MHVSLLSLLLLLADSATAPASRPAAMTGNPTMIVVVGAEGTPEYGKEFNTWADRWAEAAKKRNAQFISIGRDSSTSDSQSDDRTRLKTALDQQPTEGSDALWLIFIGHGTYDSRDA